MCKHNKHCGFGVSLHVYVSCFYLLHLLCNMYCTIKDMQKKIHKNKWKTIEKKTQNKKNHKRTKHTYIHFALCTWIKLIFIFICAYFFLSFKLTKNLSQKWRRNKQCLCEQNVLLFLICVFNVSNRSIRRVHITKN